LSWRQVAGLSLVGVLALSDLAGAAPRPGPERPTRFRLLARAVGALTINRVYCGLSSQGGVCVDSTGSGFAGGGFWPKGTPNQYVFASGFQLAAVVGGTTENPWLGDTSSAAFYHPSGGSDGEPVRPVFNSNDPADLAQWPAAAYVPSGDASEDLFNPVLRQDRAVASQGDVWWLSWDGNPNFASQAVRPHPLGVLLEHRGMGWNYPAGNEDIVYFIYTIYNITSTRAEDYAGVRPAMREILLEKARDFQRLNNAAYGVTLPAGGYPLENVYVAFAADMDVADAGFNYASVNLPFALGYSYDHSFGQHEDWIFDPGIFGPPFFPGTGFAGVKYLSSPMNAAGEEVGLTLFSNTFHPSIGGFIDPFSAGQLYRYLSATVDPAAGDDQCNAGDPKVTHICFLNNAQPTDVRFFQSSGPLTLGPGDFGSIVVAYIFAAPVADPVCSPPACDIRPGDPTILGDPARMDAAVNPIDLITGYRGHRDANGNGRIEQEEFEVVPGSLLGKALVAQEVFNQGFLLPSAPESPPFYLIPGDDQVTVLWQPSPTEASGDPFFATASSPTMTPEGGGEPVPNLLFDPNYRQFDVEGYRIYRGRVNSPDELTLIAQFDYAGSLITDFQGQVNPVAGCAPELGINTITIGPNPDDPTVPDTVFGCPVDFDSLVPGTAPTVGLDVPLVGPIVQVKRGERTRLATGEAIILRADTAFTGSASGNAPELKDTGVPFTFVDTGVRNNLRYFYSVTAFDFNSFQSGPSTLESPRSAKAVFPQAPASNFQALASLTQSIVGRGITVSQDSATASIDPATGRFSGKQPPADNVELGFSGSFAQTIFSGTGTVGARLLGLGLGDARNAIPVSYSYETSSASGQLDTVTVAITQPLADSNAQVRSVPFAAASANPELSARFGVPAGFIQTGELTQGLVAYQQHTAFGRGCHIDHLFGESADCSYNGPRWFQGNNETRADPNAGNVAGSGDATDNHNAGELPGVLTIQHPQSYTQVGGEYRAVEAVLAGAVRAADFNLYWGVGGLVDSVIDLTHNVPVPFMAESLGGGWGFLNQANSAASGSGDVRPAELTLLDWGCLYPLDDPARHPDQVLGCTAGTRYTLSTTAVPGPVVIAGGPMTEIAAAPVRANPGFSLYLAGHLFLFELAPGATLPAAGTIWTLRSYIGHVSGGNGSAGSLGPYRFTPAPRTFSAIGATVTLTYSASNQLAATTDNDLSRVHTVPDPYYVTNQFERTTQGKVIQFVNLPADCIIRIYSSSGVLVTLLEHHSDTFGGAETWNVLNRNNQVVASGVYFYHIESGDARRIGRFTVVNFAE
jgi:hypothetical protein